MGPAFLAEPPRRFEIMWNRSWKDALKKSGAESATMLSDREVAKR